MDSSTIRKSFLDYFAAAGHRVVGSAPLVPHGDPTLLFTNAGMVQFKDAFLGLEAPPAPRVATVQKCLRVSGKHNDLENVGPSPRHHTFFEMLGNFSFGDYFKEEAIRLGWGLVTEGWGLDPAHLFATVYEEDDEAAELWRRHSSLPAERILRCGAADNFWAMGETGPCGPCSEIFVDLTPDRPAVEWTTGTDSGRYLEIWNLVFMQFSRDAEGGLEPLPNPSIDTGAGLERVAAVLQGRGSNYDTDLFRPLIDEAAELAGVRYGTAEESDVALRVIADHLRAVTFLLADGVIPGADGRGYVLRRLLRRAVRHGRRLGFEEPFLHVLVPAVAASLVTYTELEATRDATVTAVRAEEEKFLDTVATGAAKVQEAIDDLRKRGEEMISGRLAFYFYGTYGLPVELVQEIAEEEQIGFDEEGFAAVLAAEQERGRQKGGKGKQRLEAVREALVTGYDHEITPFLGYDRLNLDRAKVTRLARVSDDGVFPVQRLAAGESGVVVLDRTVFYAESGGQVADRGELVAPEGAGVAPVRDVQRDPSGVVLHFVEVVDGALAIGEEVTLGVDAARRRATERNHTATHLLHAALRRVLGEGVRQAGSLVHPERLRFDFTHGRPVAESELAEVEDLVNRWVQRAVVIGIDWTTYREAVAAGAMALFGEKYGDRVRTVAVPGFSLELCGGCHVRNSGEIGLFLATSERGVASGVRRIEAVTGAEALAKVRQGQEVVRSLEAALGATGDRLIDEVGQLRGRLADAEGELARARRALVTGTTDRRADVVEVDGVEVLCREVPTAPSSELREMVDLLRQKLESGIVVVGARDGDKVILLAGVTGPAAGRLHAGRLVGDLARQLGGGGGGRPEFAQAGGRHPERLSEVLASVPDAVRRQLAS